MDDGHLIMFQWLKFYQQVMEMPPTERPADDVLDDDIELDKWYESFLRQAAARASLAKGQQGQVPAPAGTGVKRFGG